VPDPVDGGDEFVDGTVDELIASVDRVWHERLATSAAG